MIKKYSSEKVRHETEISSEKVLHETEISSEKMITYIEKPDFRSLTVKNGANFVRKRKKWVDIKIDPPLSCV